MPYAVLTFWKSEWGTRETAADVEAKGGKFESGMLAGENDWNRESTG